jgi:hypothetical protein
MTDSQNSSQLAVTLENLEVLQQNVGRVLNPEDIQDILEGKFHLLPAACISALSYRADGQLETITIGSITCTRFEIKDDPNVVINLQDFQERFQEAANFGYSVSVLINHEDKKIVRMSLFPCSCQCDEKTPDININQLRAAAQGGNLCFRKNADGSYSFYPPPCY